MAASREPQPIDKHTWYYEFPTYLFVVHWTYPPDGPGVCSHIKIPWRKVKRSMNRAYAPKKPRRKTSVR